MFVVTKEITVRARDVIGVFDLDNATVSAVTKNFLIGAEKSGEVEGIESLPKSFILTSRDKRSRIYLSSRLADYISK
jgi:hypothetical protein